MGGQQGRAAEAWPTKQQANLELQGLEAQRALAAALRPLHDTLQRGWAGSLQVGRPRRQGSAGSGVARKSSRRWAAVARADVHDAQGAGPCCSQDAARSSSPCCMCNLPAGGSGACKQGWEGGGGRRHQCSVGNEAHVARPARAHGGPHHPGAPTASPASSLTCRRWAPPGPRVCSLQGRWGTCRR